jgi:hypothetical protein
MSRRIIDCLILLALFLQGVAPVGADMLPDPLEQHCNGHDGLPMDCDCCTDEIAITGGCSTTCAATYAPAAKPLILSAALHARHDRVSVDGASGPAYPPITPPPIS